MIKIQNNQENLTSLFSFLCCFLIFLLPLEGLIRFLPNVILILLSILFLLNNSLTELKHVFAKKVIVAYAFFAMYILTRSIIEQQLISALGNLSRYLLPIAILALLNSFSYNFRWIKLAFIFGTLVSILISLISLSALVIEQGNFQFSVGEKVNRVLLTERVYIGFCCVISFIFLVDLLKSNKNSNRKLILFIISLKILFVLLIAARLSILLIVLLGLFFLFNKYKGRLLFKYSIICFFILSAAFGLNKNLRTRFFYQEKNKSFVENVKTWEPRVAIWSCSAIIFKHQSSFKKIIGIGSTEEVQNHLLNCYSLNISNSSKKEWFIKKRFNTHNQYFEFLLAYGAISLLILLYFFFLGFSTNNLLVSAFLFSFLAFGFVENYFSRQLGSYLFGILLFFLNHNEK